MLSIALLVTSVIVIGVAIYNIGYNVGYMAGIDQAFDAIEAQLKGERK